MRRASYPDTIATTPVRARGIMMPARMNFQKSLEIQSERDRKGATCCVLCKPNVQPRTEASEWAVEGDDQRINETRLF